MLIVSHNGNPIIKKKYRDKIHKKLELFFESKCFRDKTSKFRNRQKRWIFKKRSLKKDGLTKERSAPILLKLKSLLRSL